PTPPLETRCARADPEALSSGFTLRTITPRKCVNWKSTGPQRTVVNFAEADASALSGVCTKTGTYTDETTCRPSSLPIRISSVTRAGVTSNPRTTSSSAGTATGTRVPPRADMDAVAWIGINSMTLSETAAAVPSWNLWLNAGSATLSSKARNGLAVTSPGV